MKPASNPKAGIHPSIREVSSQRVFIFAESRSGSTWLTRTLGSHPAIGMLEEVFNPDYSKQLRPANTPDTGENILFSLERQLEPLTTPLKGCKILYLQAVRFLDLYEFILNYPDARYILLYRENSLRAEISGLIANQYQTWHRSDPAEIMQVEVDPAYLHERLLWRKHSRDFCFAMIGSFCPKVIQVEYSELFGNQSSHLELIARFLSCDSEGFIPDTEEKSNPFLLENVITNYTECRTWFKDLPWIATLFANDDPAR